MQTVEPANGVKTVKDENGRGPSIKNDVDYELPTLPEAPVFYPTMQEFADPMKYLASIKIEAEAAGVIKIVPPKEWRCPFPIKDNGDSFHFQTCVQSVDQLRHRHGPGTKFMQRLRHFHRTRGLHLPAEVADPCRFRCARVSESLSVPLSALTPCCGACTQECMASPGEPHSSRRSG